MPLVNVNNIKMFYKIILKGKESNVIDPLLPTMIVLHGGFGIIDHQLEVKAWTPLSSHVQLIFPDLRGCGKTEDGNPKFWTMDQFAADIFELANALGVKHPIVGGVSSGGYIALSYATQYPKHPCALVLLNTEPVVSPEAKRQAYALQAMRNDKRDFDVFKNLTDEEIVAYAQKAAQAAYNYDLKPSVENFKKFAELGYNTISKTKYDFVPPARVNMNLKHKLANGYKLFDYSSKMKNITCPVIWFAGEWDPLHPCSCAQEGSKNLPDVELHILKAGAPVYQDAADEFYKKTLEFFEKKLKLISLVRLETKV